MITFGQALKEARIKSKLKRHILGEKLNLGININNWSAWERNINFPNLEVLKNICRVLELDYKVMTKRWVEAKVLHTRKRLEEKRKKAIEEYEK